MLLSQGIIESILLNRVKYLANNVPEYWKLGKDTPSSSWPDVKVCLFLLIVLLFVLNSAFFLALTKYITTMSLLLMQWHINAENMYLDSQEHILILNLIKRFWIIWYRNHWLLWCIAVLLVLST